MELIRSKSSIRSFLLQFTKDETMMSSNMGVCTNERSECTASLDKGEPGILCLFYS